MSSLIWLAIVATLLSGFFGLNNFALRALRRARLEEAFSGPRGKVKLELLDRHLRALQLTASLGRALANLVLVVAILYLFDPVREAMGRFNRALLATAAAGVIIAIFGVGIPHAWASHAGEKVIRASLPLMMLFRYLFYPFIAMMQAMDVPIRRLAGVISEEDENAEHAKQEILQAATEGRAEGAFGLDEVKMIASVIEFGHIQAGKIMTPRTDIFALPVEMTAQEAAAKVMEGGHSRVPVYEGDLDNIIGILYAKDLLGQVGKDGGDLRRIMRKPFFVPETKPLSDLLKEFKTRRVHLSIVLDEYGGTAGLVSIEDIVEEIIGDIADEYDIPEPALMNRIDEKTAEVDGRLYIDDLNEAMGLEIPEDADYDTIAGLIFSELGYIPPAGEVLEAYGARYTVLAADERKITKVRVEKLTHPSVDRG